MIKTKPRRGSYPLPPLNIF